MEWIEVALIDDASTTKSVCGVKNECGWARNWPIVM